MGETEEGTEIAKRALANVGHETQMRKELSDAYRGLLEYGQCQPALEINDAIRVGKPSRTIACTTSSPSRSGIW